MSTLIWITILVFVLNIPFGYWRSNVRSFSGQWFLAIHIPVPFIVALRLISGVGFAWYTYLFLVMAFFLGQKTGGIIMKRIHRVCQQTSSCLVMDIIHCSHLSR
jgi:hypothetical protein